MARTISLQECKAKVEIHNDDEHDFMSTVRPFTLEVTHMPTHKQVGHIEGSIINRNRSRGRFLAVLDEESDELHKVSQGLFDKNGMVKASVVGSEFHKGLGVWGRELDQGLLVYVGSVRVNTEVSIMMLKSSDGQMLKAADYSGSLVDCHLWCISRL